MIRSRKTHTSSLRAGRARTRCVPLTVERLEDRTLLAATTLVNNGPSANRVDIVFLGDGYTAADIAAGTYRNHVETMLKHLFEDGQDPYPRYHNFFNVYMVEVASPESGIDNPTQQINRNTALDGTYGCANIQRLICIDTSKADAMAAESPVAPEMRLVTVNSTEYGGSGGSWAVYAGGNAGSAEIALHELGHSFDGFADEYESTCANYTGPEPDQANVTTSSTGQKWSEWLGYNQPGIGVIGAYQGGLFCYYGIYRPSQNSKMRTLGLPFDAIAREKIILDIYNLVDPLDSWLDTTTARTGDDTLWVKVVDPSVIRVEWYVDGTRVPAASGESFRPSDFGIALGAHTVTAHAVDPTDWVRRDREQLEQSVSWTVNVLTDSPPSVVPVPVEPTIADARLVASSRKGAKDIVLTLSGAAGLSASDIENVSHYQLVSPGSDRRFGTGDDRPIAIQSAVFDAAHATLTLTASKSFPSNQLVEISTRFTDGSGAARASAADSQGMIIGRGAKLSYVDSDGDLVSLSLSHGGVMELTMGPGDKGLRLRLLDTVPNRSILSGKVKRGQTGGDGSAHLASISGTAGVRNKLSESGSPFVIGSISAAIDALLESRSL